MPHTLADLQRIADIQFSDIVLTTFMIEHKLRIMLRDMGFIDVHLAQDAVTDNWKLTADNLKEKVKDRQ